MDDITLSRNYRAVWAEARKKNTFAALEEVFEQMASELQIPDPEREKAQSSYSEEVAKRKNEQESSGIKRKP